VLPKYVFPIATGQNHCAEKLELFPTKLTQAARLMVTYVAELLWRYMHLIGDYSSSDRWKFVTLFVIGGVRTRWHS
jgi:hypothetical protein